MSSFMKALLEERLQMSESDIHRSAMLSGSNLFSSEYRVLIVSCNHLIEDLAAFRAYCLELPALCKRFFGKKSIHAEVENDFSGNCTILLMESVGKSSVEKLSMALLSYLESHQFPDVVIAIGKVVTSIVEVPYSYKTAFNALSYQSLYSGEKCLFCEDLQAMMNLKTLQSIIDPQMVLEAFQADDMSRLRLLVTAYAEKARALSGDSVEGKHPTSIRRLFVELTVYVLHMASDFGVNVDEFLQDNDPYSFLLFEEKATPVIIDWFMSMCAAMRTAIDAKAKVKKQTILQRVCSYIDEHITQSSLSLEETSAFFGITPSYLSNMFHKEMQIGFSKYISERRIAIAKQLLEETDLSVKEIAAMSGYSSANYFGIVFKRMENMSAIQYRLWKREGNEE